MLGLLLTLPLTFGAITIGPVTFSLYWMLAGFAATCSGSRACTWVHRADLLRLHRQRSTSAARVVPVHPDRAPQRRALRGRAGPDHPAHQAVPSGRSPPAGGPGNRVAHGRHRAAALLSGFITFVFMLLVHAASRLSNLVYGASERLARVRLPGGLLEQLHCFVSRRDQGHPRRAGRRRSSTDRRGAGGGAGVRWAAVHPRRRRLGRARQPRGQRLPQDLRVRGLRAHRQRLRAHRPRQRRGLGHDLRPTGCRARGCAPATRLLVFSVGGGEPREATSPSTWCARSSTARRRARASSASSAATAAHTAEAGRRLRGHPAAVPERITPHTEGLCAVRLAPAGEPPGAEGPSATKWESVASVSAQQRRERLHRRRRRLHRQPLRRPAALRGQHSSGSPSSTTSPPGGEWHLERHARRSAAHRRARATSRTCRALRRAMDGHDVVIHLASNPDIARAATEPDIDFDEGTLLTHHVVEAMRHDPARRILYASGSGVYGDLGELEADEDHGPLVADVDLRRQQARRRGADRRPTRTCSASAAARSASATSSARARPTASGFDFVRRLLRRPDASCGSSATAPRASPTSTSTTSSTPCSSPQRPVRQAVRRLQRRDRRLHHGPRDRRAGVRVPGPRAGNDHVRLLRAANRGWKGDVPVVRLSTERIRSLGWGCRRSTREALQGVDAWRCCRMPGQGVRERRARGGAFPAGRLPRPRRRAQPGGRARRAAVSARRRSRSSRCCRAWPRPAPRCAGAGFALVVVTNQPDVARGTQTPRGRRGAQPAALRAGCRVDEIRVCPHDDRDGCACRKPAPGLLAGSRERRETSTSRRSVMVGDRWRDIEAGERAGCWTVFVDHGYAERRPERPDLTVRSLGEAVPWILATASGKAIRA